MPHYSRQNSSTTTQTQTDDSVSIQSGILEAIKSNKSLGFYKYSGGC